MAAIGGYGQHYLQALLDEVPAGHARLAGVVDPFARESAAWPRVRDLGVPVVDEVQEFFAAGHRADLTVVSSPIHFHVPQTLAALAGGSHVLCDKPLGATVPGVDECRRGSRPGRPLRDDRLSVVVLGRDPGAEARPARRPVRPAGPHGHAVRMAARHVLLPAQQLGRPVARSRLRRLGARQPREQRHGALPPQRPLRHGPGHGGERAAGGGHRRTRPRVPDRKRRHGRVPCADGRRLRGALSRLARDRTGHRAPIPPRVRTRRHRLRRNRPQRRGDDVPTAASGTTAIRMLRTSSTSSSRRSSASGTPPATWPAAWRPRPRRPRAWSRCTSRRWRSCAFPRSSGGGCPTIACTCSDWRTSCSAAIGRRCCRAKWVAHGQSPAGGCSRRWPSCFLAAGPAVSPVPGRSAS